MFSVELHTHSSSFLTPPPSSPFSVVSKELRATPPENCESFWQELLFWGEANATWTDLKIRNTLVPKENALKWAKLNLELKVDAKDFEFLATTFPISHVDDLLKSPAIPFLKVVCLKLPHLVEKYLVEMDADPNATCTFWNQNHKTTVSALRFAIHWKDADTFEVLLKHGASLTSSRAEKVLTKSYQSEKYRSFAPIIIKYKGHQLSTSYFVDPSTMISQFKCVDFFHATLFYKDNLAFLNFLLNNGASINDLCNNESLLFLATEDENLETMQWLYKRGALINHGKNPLLACQNHKNLECAKWLINHGAKLNPSNTPLEEQPLVAAHQNKNDKLVALLIDAGAKMPTNYLVKLLKENTLFEPSTCLEENLEKIKDLTERGAVNPNSIDETSKLKSPFAHYAIAIKDFALLKALLDAGANPNCQDINGIAPLHLTILYKDYDIAKLLLDYGAKINLPTKSGHTPLHLLAHVRFDEKIGNLLLENGAALDKRDANDRIPFGRLLSFRVTLPFAQKMAKKGVHPLGTTGEAYKDQIDLYSSYKKTHHPLSKKYLPTPVADLTKHVWQEHYLREILAHIYDIGGYSPISFRKSPLKILGIVRLEGTAFSNYLSRKGVKVTRLLFRNTPTLLPKASFSALLNTHRFNANFENSPRAYAKRIASGKPTVIHGGFNVHAVSYFFYKDQQGQHWFLLCNTGAESRSGPLEAFLYNPKKLKEEHIKQLFQLKLEGSAEYRSFIRTFLTEIESKNTPITEAFEKQVPFGMQTKGHCVWTSFEVVNWALVVLPQVADKHVDEVPAEASKWLSGFEKWRRLMGTTMLLKYLNFHLSTNYPYVPDTYLLKHIKQSKKTLPPKELIPSIETLESTFPADTAKVREERICAFKDVKKEERANKLTYKQVRKTYLGD